jgi:hypothetical protein
MADSDTNVTSTPDEPGNNDEGTEGTHTQGVQAEETPKTYTQDDVNRMVQTRLAEQQSRSRASSRKIWMPSSPLRGRTCRKIWTSSWKTV